MSSSSIEREVIKLSKEGWIVVHKDETGAQMKKPKRVSVLGVLVLVVAPLLLAFFIRDAWIISAIGAALILTDYANKREETVYVRLDHSQTAPATAHPAPTNQALPIGGDPTRRP